MDKKNIESIYPLTPVQELMLVHSLQSGKSDHGQLQTIYTFRGMLDSSIFRKSMDVITQRHSVLRTSIHWEEAKKPLQVVHKSVKIPWLEFDLSNVTDEERKTRFQEIIDECRTRKLDLTKAPVMRGVLIKMDEQHFKFVWYCHHILLDGWSGAIVLKEILAAYTSFKKAYRFDKLDAPQFRDYFNWLNTQEMSSAESFWKTALENRPLNTGLLFAGRITKSGREPQHNFREETCSLSVETTEMLKLQCQKTRSTMNAFALCSWAILLQLYSGIDDVIFGMTVSGRPSHFPHSDEMVGVFTNTIPVRLQINRESSVRSLLSEAMKWYNNIAPFEHVPLSKIEEWSTIGNNRQLFETLLVFDNHPWDKPNNNIAECDLKLTNIHGDTTSIFPITVTFTPTDRLALSIVFDTARFGSSRISDILQHLKIILQYLVEHPDVKNLNKITALIDITQPRNSHETAKIPELLRSGTELRETTPKHTSYIEPRNKTEHQLWSIWQKILGEPKISVNDDFFDIGGGSIAATQLFIEVEKVFGKRMSVVTLFKARTIASLAEILQENEFRPNWESIVPLQTNGRNRPLFFIPNQRSSVIELRSLPKYLGKNQPLYGFQYRGFGGEAAPHSRIEDMAEYFIDELKNVQPNGPYRLAGRCFGCKVAFEMAYQLHHLGESVELLAIIDAEPPYVKRPDYIPPVRKTPVHYFRRSVHHLKRGNLSQIAKNTVKKFTGSLTTQQERDLNRVVDAHQTANQSYVAKEYNGKVTLIFSEESDKSEEYADDRKLWTELALGGLEYHVVPGVVEFLFDEPHVEHLAKCLTKCIDKLDAIEPSAILSVY